MKKILALILALTMLLTLFAGCKSEPDPASSTPSVSSEAESSEPESSEGGYTPDPNKEIEIEFAAGTGVFSDEGWDYLFNNFNKHYPNIKVKTEISADINDILAARVVTGDMPDIVWGGMPNGYELLKAGKCYNFNDFFQSPALDFDGTVEESLMGGMADAETYNGGRYLVPNNPGFYGVCYDADLFEENGWDPPRNWEELLALAPKIKATGKTPLAYGTTGRLQLC